MEFTGTMLGGTWRRTGGRPRTITPYLEQWLLTRNDGRKAAYQAKYDEPLTDSKALRNDMFHSYFGRFTRQGMSESDAVKLARSLSSGPHFRSLKVRLSRLRSGARKHRLARSLSSGPTFRSLKVRL